VPARSIPYPCGGGAPWRGCGTLGCGFPPFDVIADPELLVPPQFRWPLLALAASHGLSFASHYLLGGERLSASRQALTGRPCGRIVVGPVHGITGILRQRCARPRAAPLTTTGESS
jgi:hypothetical protein